jgi:hypothetical protein
MPQHWTAAAAMQHPAPLGTSLEVNDPVRHGTVHQRKRTPQPSLAKTGQHHGVLWKETSAHWKRRSDFRNSLHKTETLVVAAANGISYRSADVVGLTNQTLKMTDCEVLESDMGWKEFTGTSRGAAYLHKGHTS